MMMNDFDDGHDIVLIGGGIQSACIAYYLMKHGVRCTIIEEVAIAAAASGKAGGFLAKNWGDPTTQGLHDLSYELHKEIADILSLESYRQIKTMRVANGTINNKRKLDSEMAVSWIDKSGIPEMMDAFHTAQVCPMELTTKLVEAAVAFGTKVIIGRVCGIGIVGGDDGNGYVSGVQYLDEGVETFLAASKVVITTGPWAGVHAQDWLGINVPMQGLKATSMVYRNCPSIIQEEPYALFCDEDRNGCELEVYPRNNGEIYVCGCGDSEFIDGTQLRSGGSAMNATVIQPNSTRAHIAARSFSAMTSLGERWADVTQACMLPYSGDGYPVMGAFEGLRGAYISSGHNCWGILLAPASGLCMSELIVNGECTKMDLTPFRPDRFGE